MIKLVAFGDSTTAPRGALRTYLDCLRHDLPMQDMEVAAVNAGTRGDTTARTKERFAKDVLNRHPDITIIQFGINDSTIDVWQTPPATQPRVTLDQYIHNIEYFVKTLQAQDCKVILMTPNPMCWTRILKKIYGKPPYRPDDPDGFNMILRAYVADLRRLTRKLKLPLVDVYAAFQAHAQSKGQTIGDLLLDGMHPNNNGHRLVANLLIKEIIKIQAPP